MGFWTRLFKGLLSNTKSHNSPKQLARTASSPPDSSQRASPQPATSSTSKSSPEQSSLIRAVPSLGSKMLNDHMPWLNEKWTTLQQQKDSGIKDARVERFFEDVTERQLRKLEVLGVTLRSGRPTKGQALDLIGLFEAPYEEEEEILRHFKISLSGMSHSRAEYEISKLLDDPQKREQWEGRGATQMQREFYRYFNLKLPAKLTARQAEEFMKTYSDTVSEEEWEEWEAYESMYEEVNDPDEREHHEIKKVSLTMYRSAMQDIKKVGKKLADIDPSESVREVYEGLQSLRTIKRIEAR